ncbi:MAG: undecaprenyl-diphosphate phosphatase [Oscillospiraceae bacterium]
MTLIDAVVQAVIQGLTEFLPVSSSGHISLYQHFTGNSGEGALLFSAILHLGTLVAVFIAFRDTIWALMKECVSLIKDLFTGKFKWSAMNGERRMIIMLIISLLMLIPFYLFKDFFEGISEDNDIIVEGFCFIYTSIILMISDRCSKGKKTPENITLKDSVAVGIFQGFALLPGVSRSGSTICGGLFSGFSRDTAVKYSFILGIPAILGGCLLEIKDAVQENAVEIDFLPYIVGMVIAAVVGVMAIKMVSWLVNSNKFKIFAFYTLILGICVILIGVFEKIIGMNIVEYMSNSSIL